MRLTLNSKPVCHLFGQKNALPVKGGQFSLEENKFLSGRFFSVPPSGHRDLQRLGAAEQRPK